MRKLTQAWAALQLGVKSWTVLNWEKGHTEPPIEFIQVILQFLAYDPYPLPKTLPERMLAKRRTMGWSIKEAARQLGVDEGTWAAWERGVVILFRKHRALVTGFLGTPPDQVTKAMGTQWNWRHPKRIKLGS